MKIDPNTQSQLNNEADKILSRYENLSSIEPLYLRISAGLKKRVIHQCRRLGINQNAFSKMALTRAVEEEEKRERQSKEGINGM